MQRVKVTNCAALFIDIRGSSAISAIPGVESSTIARQTNIFWNLVKTLLEKSDADLANPAMVKSLGDGLLCVWDFSNLRPNEYVTRKRSLVKAVLNLDNELADQLNLQWRSTVPIKTGMGLAMGDAAQAQVGRSRDYFGYVVNLAAKLQGFARPSGLVIDGESAQDVVMHFASLLRPHELEIFRKNEISCYVTPSVSNQYKWTCLAWPGLALNNGDAPLRPPGLNTMGISVITHEGIREKLGTLQVWPRNDPRDDTGDPFDLIIDDFDRLAIMYHEKAINLAHYDRRFALRQQAVSQALSFTESRDDFFFAPLRCGLNALAWNTNYPGSRIKRYSDVLRITRSYANVALYDYAGASLPVLLRCLSGHFDNKSVFDADEEDFEALKRLLSSRQAELREKTSHERLFILYPTIHRLALALHSGTDVQVVLGGGAWLADGSGSRNVKSGIPINDEGFLWVEGTALRGDSRIPTAEVAKMMAFIEDILLSSGYQESLISAEPFGATPVNPNVLGRILSKQKEIRSVRSPGSQSANGSKGNSLLARLPRSRLTLLETMTLFQTRNKLKPNIKVRMRPDRITEWNATWNYIREHFCRVP